MDFDKEQIKRQVKRLANSFDDDYGLSKQTYIATSNIIWHILGQEASRKFSNIIDTTENRYYLKKDANLDFLN